MPFVDWYFYLIVGSLSPALGMHPGMHLQQIQAHLLRSNGLLPTLAPHPPDTSLPHPHPLPIHIPIEVRIFNHVILFTYTFN